jgi:ATP-dependent DNA helicase DinG
MRHLDVVRRGGFDFQVCNHNYLLADIIHRNKGLNPLLPDYQAIVIDEAHKFLDAARVMYGSELPLAELCGVIKDIRSYTFVPGQSTAEIVRETDRLLSKSRLLFEMLGREVPEPESDEESERSATKIRQRAEKLIRAMKEDADALTALLEARTVIPKYTSSFTAAIRSLRKISEALGEFIRHGDLVYWLEERAEYSAFELRDAGFRLNTLCGIPKNLSTLLHRDLWSMNIPIILTSGTLSAAGSFEHMKRKTGINLLPARRLSETTKPSPFNHRENALIYVSENTPFPNNDDPSYIGSIAAEVERLVSASNGHAAVLFTSYKAMDMVWGKISARKLPYPLFRLNRGGAEVIEQFKRSGNGILFAAGALWEGIDIPGDILSMLIIVRLPFAVPDPVSEWEKTLYPSMSAYKTQVIVPEMLVKLKQGFGRLIRIESDIGVVALLDFRMRSDGAYRSDALRALPLCRVTDSIAEVQDFLLLKKPPEYFSTKALAC